MRVLFWEGRVIFLHSYYAGSLFEHTSAQLVSEAELEVRLDGRYLMGAAAGMEKNPGFACRFQESNKDTSGNMLKINRKVAGAGITIEGCIPPESRSGKHQPGEK